MGRIKRIGYKALAIGCLVIGSYVFTPSLPLVEEQQRLFVGLFYGIAASILHDIAGDEIVKTLVGTRGSILSFIAIAVVIVTWGGVIIALLWSTGEVVVAFLPGFTDVAQTELRSLDVYVAAITVIVIEVINTEDRVG